MKKIIALGVIFIPIMFFVSCDPRSGGAGGGGPIEPPAVNTPAKIGSVSVSPSTSIVLTGMNPINKVTITASATGNPTPSITINGVSGSQYTSDTLFVSKSFPISANNGVGSPDVTVANVVVTVDPTFAKLCGNTMSGRSFKLISATAQPVGGGTVTNIMTPCLEDDVVTFWCNGKVQINYGSAVGCTTGLSQTVSFWFNPSTMGYNTIGTIPAQPDKTVDFPSTNVMVHTYEYNGSRYTLTYQVQ